VIGVGQDSRVPSCTVSVGRSSIMEYNLFPTAHGRHPIVTPIAQIFNDCVRSERRRKSKQEKHLINKFILGKIVSTFDLKNVCLPVRSEVLLPKVGPEYDVAFLKNLASKTNYHQVQMTFIKDVCIGIKGEGRRSRRIGDAVKIREFHSERFGKVIISTGENVTPNIECFKIVQLGKVSVLRPMASVHYQFECIGAQHMTDLLKKETLYQEVINDEECTVYDKSSRTWAIEVEDGETGEWSILLYLEMVEAKDITPRNSSERMRLASNPNVAITFDEDDEEAEDRSNTLECSARLPIARIEKAYLRDPILSDHLDKLPYGEPGEGLLQMVTDTLVIIRQMADVFDAVVKKEIENTAAGAESPLDSLYYPGLFGDMAAGAKQHYNKKQIGSQSGDDLEFLRRYNNMCKRLLIEENCPLESVIVDIACGHGQDMIKYEQKQALFFYGADISEEEIMEARRRLRQAQQNKRRNLSWMQYHVGNLLSSITWNNIRKAIIKQKITRFGQMKAVEKYDVVSCQLAIHYCLANEKQSRELLKQIASILTKGGIFYGSCPDTAAIAMRLCTSVKRVQRNQEFRSTTEEPSLFSVGNRYYSFQVSEEFMAILRDDYPVTEDEGTISGPRVHFHPRTVQQIESRGGSSVPNELFDPTSLEGQEEFEHVKNILYNSWGLQYHFSLRGHIDMAEYVIPWTALCQLASEFGLQLSFEKNFNDFMNEKREQYQTNPSSDNPKKICEDLYRDIGNRMPVDAREEQENVAGFYKVFAFKKIGSAQEINLFKPSTLDHIPDSSKSSTLTTDILPPTATTISRPVVEAPLSRDPFSSGASHVRSNTPTLGGLGAIQSSIDVTAYGQATSDVSRQMNNSMTFGGVNNMGKVPGTVDDDSSSVSSSDDDAE